MYDINDMNLSPTAIRRTFGALGAAGTAVVVGPAAIGWSLGVALCGAVGYVASDYKNIAHSCIGYLKNQAKTQGEKVKEATLQQGAEFAKELLQQGQDALRNRVSPEHQQLIQAIRNPNTEQAPEAAAALQQIEDSLANGINLTLGAVLPVAAVAANVWGPAIRVIRGLTPDAETRAAMMLGVSEAIDAARNRANPEGGEERPTLGTRAATQFTSGLTAMTNHLNSEEFSVAGSAMQVVSTAASTFYNTALSQCSEENRARVETALQTFETFRNQPLSTSARQATEAIAHYAVCKSMTEEQRGEVFNAIWAGGTTLRAVKEHFFSTDAEGEASFIQWITQVAQLKLAQIDELVNTPGFDATEAAKAEILDKAKRLNQWVQDVTGITEHRRNITDKKRSISNTVRRVAALFNGTPQANVEIEAGNAIVPQQAPVGNGQAPAAVADGEAAAAAPQDGILATADQTCATIEEACGSGFLNVFLGALGFGAMTAATKVAGVAQRTLGLTDEQAEQVKTQGSIALTALKDHFFTTAAEGGGEEPNTADGVINYISSRLDAINDTVSAENFSVTTSLQGLAAAQAADLKEWMIGQIVSRETRDKAEALFESLGGLMPSDENRQALVAAYGRVTALICGGVEEGDERGFSDKIADMILPKLRSALELIEGEEDLNLSSLFFAGLSFAGSIVAGKVKNAAQWGLNQVISQSLQEEVTKTWNEVKDMAAPLLGSSIDKDADSDIESDDDDAPHLNPLERGVKFITSSVNSVLDFANGTSSPSKERSTAEALQRASEIIPSPVGRAEEEDYHKKSQTELNKTIELLTFKTIYRAFTVNGAQIDSFEEMVRLFETNNGELTGAFETSARVFLREIKEQMASKGLTPWYTAIFINTIISPLISATVMSAAPRISQSFYNQVTEAIHLNASDDLNTTSLSTLKETTEICKKIDKSYFTANKPDRIENIRSSKNTEERIFELVNRTPEGREKLYKDATNAFIDLHFKDPIKFLDDVKDFKNELKDKIDSLNKNDVPMDQKLLIPLIAIGYVFTAVFELLMTLFIKPLNMIINAIAKGIAIKNGFFEEIITSTVESLSGENNGNKTIVLDKLFILVLDEANKEIQDLVDDYSPEFDPLPALKKDEEKTAREFIQAILKTSATYEDEESLVKSLEAIPVIGEKLTKLGLNKITLLLYNIYKKVTTKDQMEKYIAKGLEALNNNLRSDAQENIPDETKRQNQDDSEKRQNTLEGSINALGRRLVKLCVKVINKPIHPPIDDFQEEYDSLLTRALKLEFSPENLEEGDDEEILESNLLEIQKTIDHLAEFIDDIKAIENSPVHKLNPLRDNLTPVANAIVNMLEHLNKKRKYYLACIISSENIVEGKDETEDQEKIERKDMINDFLAQIKDLKGDEDLESQLITLATGINSIKTAENHKEYNHIKRNIQRLTALMVEKKYYSNSVDFYKNLKGELETFTLIETDGIVRNRLEDQITHYMSKHPFEKFLDDDNLVELLKGTDEYRKVERYNSRSIFYKSSDEPHDITRDVDNKESVKTEILRKLFAIYPKDRNSTKDKASKAEYFLTRRSALIKEFDDELNIAQSTIDNNINASIKDLLRDIRKHHKEYEKFMTLKNEDEESEKFTEVYDEYVEAIQKAKDKDIEPPSHKKTKIPRALVAMGLEKVEPIAAEVFTTQIQNIMELVRSSLFTTKAAQTVVEGFFLGEKNKASA